MSKWTYKLIISSVFLCGCLCITLTSFAAEKASFSVTPILSEAQQAQGKSYFDLRMNAGTTETISVSIQNDENYPIHLSIWSQTAHTNQNGVVDYSIKPEAETAGDTLFEDAIQAPKQITIPANKSQRLDMKVHMPNQPFLGVIAGGLNFKETVAQNQKQTTKDINISNSFKYVIAVLMRQHEEIIPAKLELERVMIPDIDAAKAAITFQFKNPVAEYLNQLQFKGEILDEKGKRVYTFSEKELQMAPNSLFFYTLTTPKKLKPGKYKINVTAYGNDQKEGRYKMKNLSGEELHLQNKWEFQKALKISTKEAAQIYQQSKTNSTHQSIHWIVWAIVAIVILGTIQLIGSSITKFRKKNF